MGWKWSVLLHKLLTVDGIGHWHKFLLPPVRMLLAAAVQTVLLMVTAARWRPVLLHTSVAWVLSWREVLMIVAIIAVKVHSRRGSVVRPA